MNAGAAPSGTVTPAGDDTYPVPALVWAIASALVLAYLGAENWPSPTADNSKDWEFFYPAAEALARGTDLYESGIGGYIYPPFLAFLLIPLVPLGFFVSAQVWLAISIGALVVALALAADDMAGRLGAAARPARVSAAVFVGLIFSLNFTRRELEHTQTDWITVLGFVIGLLCMDTRPLVAGAALGIAANVKYHTLIVVPYLLLRARYRTAGATVVFALGAAVLPALAIGWERNLEYLARAFGGLAQFVGIDVPRRANVWEIENLDSISATSALARAGRAMGGGTGLTLALVAAAAGACVALAWLMYRVNGFAFLGRGTDRAPGAREPGVGGRARGPMIAAAEWAGLITATLVFSPQTLKRHMFVMLPVYAMVAVLLLARRPGAPHRGKGVLLAGLGLSMVAIFAPPRPAGHEGPSDAWRAVGGPSWGLLILFFALLWTTLAWDRAPAETREPSASA